ncbi:hypothetical protein M5K25_008427 [Dendrobium thyrsiflorum]|uniref:Uncharacterized protein n=1 Tax=Dendrobium thyrsiflorum TaxID=117978 RepID=A0ABD0V8R8_DENTH
MFGCTNVSVSTWVLCHHQEGEKEGFSAISKRVKNDMKRFSVVTREGEKGRGTLPSLGKDHAFIDNNHMKLLDEFDDLKKKFDEIDKLNDELERDGKTLIDENIHREHLLNIEIRDLKHMNSYLEKKKYSMIYPEPPTQEPIFFTHASFRALFHEDQAAGGEDVEGERQAALEPAPAPDQNAYQEMIQ